MDAFPPPAQVTLDSALDYDGIFRVVRSAVRAILGRERAGLGLALARLPPHLGAYWPVSGNLIVLNQNLVEAMRARARSRTEFNSFVFVVLTHEYLHALGYLDERAARATAAEVTRRCFGPDHPATQMAEGDLWRLFPFLAWAGAGDGRQLTIVRGFDRDETQSYIR